jgi:6-phosphogluconate dehydrogenase
MLTNTQKEYIRDHVQASVKKAIGEWAWKHSDQIRVPMEEILAVIGERLLSESVGMISAANRVHDKAPVDLACEQLRQALGLRK